MLMATFFYSWMACRPYYTPPIDASGSHPQNWICVDTSPPMRTYEECAETSKGTKYADVITCVPKREKID